MWLNWEGSKQEPKTALLATPEVIRQQVKVFVSRKTKMIGPESLSDTTALFSSGLLDSLSFIQLIVFLESTFHIQLNRKQIGLKNLDTIAQIIQLVAPQKS